MKIEILHFSWSLEDDVYHGGDGPVEFERPTKKQLAAIGAAADAPDPPIRVISASKEERAAMGKAVQSQADGEKAYAAAQRSGEWQEGNLRAVLAVYEERLRAHKAGELPMNEEGLARHQRTVEETKAVLEQLDKGLSYDEATDRVTREREAARIASEGST